MNSWPEYKLGEICQIKGGKRLPAGHSLSPVDTEHKYIRSRDIKSGKISSAQLASLEGPTRHALRRFSVATKDVCITIVANIGDVGIVPKELEGSILTENAVKLTNFSSDVSPDYLNVLLSCCLLYTSPSPRDQRGSRMPSSA